MSTKENKNMRQSLISELAAGSSIFAETRIEEREDWNPHCVLPENYFEFAIHRHATGANGVPLSINSWDGREIMSVIRRH